MCVCVCITVCLCSVCVVLFVDYLTSDDLSHAFCKVGGSLIFLWEGREHPPFFNGREGMTSFF